MAGLPIRLAFNGFSTLNSIRELGQLVVRGCLSLTTMTAILHQSLGPSAKITISFFTPPSTTRCWLSKSSKDSLLKSEPELDQEPYLSYYESGLSILLLHSTPSLIYSGKYQSRLQRLWFTSVRPGGCLVPTGPSVRVSESTFISGVVVHKDTEEHQRSR
jgi:hypothetical protein